jgi:hypothetical protein
MMTSQRILLLANPITKQASDRRLFFIQYSLGAAR